MNSPRHRRPQLIAPLLASVCLSLAITAFSQSPAKGAATFDSLAQRLPAGTNAIVAIDISKLLETPYAKAQGWAENLTRAWDKEPVMIPPGATRMLMAADVQTSTMESRWELTLMDMDKMPTVQSLAQAEGGHIDRIWDKDAACSPINAYFIPLDNRILASITPAARSEIARWIRTPVKPEGNVTSPYINTVLKSLGANTHAVMALELEAAWGLPVIRRFLDGSQIKEIDPRTMDATVNVLGSMNGIRLDLTVAERVTGRATIDFDRDTAVLKDSAKPIMLAILDAAGMRIQEVQGWTFAASGKQVTMQGNLDQASLHKLFSFVQSPIPAAVVAKTPTSGTGSTPTDPAQASLRYYKAICGSLDSLREGTSISATAVWFRNTTKRIDQLPILNVDPALVQWGSMVSTKLKLAASTLSVGSIQIQSRVAGVMDPEYEAYDYGPGYSSKSRGDTTSLGPEYYNTVRERQRVATEQKAQSAEQALRILTEIAETRPGIRAQMVQKYNVEF